MSTPKLSPFVPVYKGLPGDALPAELATATPEGEMDSVSLFWRARKLQALVFQVRPGHTLSDRSTHGSCGHAGALALSAASWSC